MKHYQNNTNHDKYYQQFRETETTRKHQPFVKTFHKKYQNNGLSITSPKKPINSLNKSKSKPRLISNQNSYRNIATTVQGQTFTRNGLSNAKLDDEKSMNQGYRIYEETKLQLSLQKLEEIINIFGRRVGNEPCQIIQDLYNRNQEYVQLLYQWQKLQIYDEIDKKIYKLTQHYLHIIQLLMEKICKKYNDHLEKYEFVLKELQQRNNKLEEIVMNNNALNIGQKGYFQSIIKEMHEKNIFSTVLLCEIQKNNFDLYNFARIIHQTESQYLQINLEQLKQDSLSNHIIIDTKSQMIHELAQSSLRLNQKREAINQKRSLN